jgi:hypothetical protein
MREKQWIDCPACGAKKSMRMKRHLSERFNPAGYGPMDIAGLDGQFCDSCGEGFWSLKSERRIARLLAEHMARQDAARVVVAELASVQEAASVLHMSVQGVHKMMDEGRLRYVVAGGRRLPIRKSLPEKQRPKSRAPAVSIPR